MRLLLLYTLKKPCLISVEMLWLTFSSKLDWGFYFTSIAKTVPKKIGALICSMKFLSPEVALYLSKSTIQPTMEYCCHIWEQLSCSQLLLGVQISYKNGYAGSLFIHLLPLLNPWFIIKMQPAYIFSIGVTLVDVLLNWLNWIHFFTLKGGLLIIVRLHDFSVNIP